MEELAEWNKFHPKGTLQIIQMRFRQAGPALSYRQLTQDLQCFKLSNSNGCSLECH
jgi:hypothetical protein